jgi:DNA polymerase-1
MTASRPLGPGDRVFLVDGSSFVFRAYFQSMNQDRKYNTRADGLPTGAVRLFSTKLMQFIRDGAVGIMPTHLAIVFDKTEQSFRKEIFPDYKAHRPEPPSDLVPQFRLMREAVRAFGLVPVEKEGFEADDIIATYAREAAEAGAEVLIVSSDKDLMQVVGDNVTFYDFESGFPGKPGYRPERRLDREGVVEKFGVPPERVIDVQALVGDPTDNVPGVPGIGIKTAAQLICEYGDLETLLARVDEIKQPKRREALVANAEQARISKQLVTLDQHVEVDVPLGAHAVELFDAKRLIAFSKALGLTTLTKRAADLYGVDAGRIAADPELAKPYGGAGSFMNANGSGGSGDGAASSQDDGSSLSPAPSVPGREGASGSGAPAYIPATLVTARLQESKAPFDRTRYVTVRTLQDLDRWLAAAADHGIIAIGTQTDSIDPMRAVLFGFSLAVEPGLSCYVPLRHRPAGDGAGSGANLFDDGLLPEQVPLDAALARLKALLENPGVLKIGQNLKYDWLLLRQHGITIAPYDDTMLISYVLDAGRAGLSPHGLEKLARSYLEHECPALGETLGKGKSAVTFDRLPVERATEYAAERADVTLRLWRLLKPRLAAERRTSVYETLERPLVATLAGMEGRGIAIDPSILSRMSGEFAQTIARIEDEIFDIAGERFTIGSPKQLADILFGKFGLAGARKTATGQWSTGARLLEDLAETSDHPLPRKILEWRQLTKLKNTYTDALPGYVNPDTGRVHTSYSLAATTTGACPRPSRTCRTSRSGPRRAQDPHRLRVGARPQADLGRLLADRAAPSRPHGRYPAAPRRLRGRDRHPRAHGLGDVRRAGRRHVARYPPQGEGDQLRHRLRHLGLRSGKPARHPARRGRRLHQALLRTLSGHPRLHGFHEALLPRDRLCRNAVRPRLSLPGHRDRQRLHAGGGRAPGHQRPIQGTAADIIRRAMARMDKALGDAGLSARMLLQVHDELVLEAPDAEVEATLPVVTRVMVDAAHPAVQLKVPLAVDARAADNWDAAH